MTTATLSPQELAQALDAAGGCVGVKAASELLGIKPPNFRRDARPFLVEIAVEGSASVYVRSDVEELARRRAAGRNGDG